MASNFVKGTDMVLKELKEKMKLRKVRPCTSADSGTGSGEGKDAS